MTGAGGWGVGEEGVRRGLQGLRGDSDGFPTKKRNERPSKAGAVTQHRSISLATAPPTPPPPARGSPCHPSPSVDSINKPGAGPRLRTMVHLEVTGKENRGLCMAKSTRDKHREALRDLDKGLTDHVGNRTHFLKRDKKKKKKELERLCSPCKVPNKLKPQKGACLFLGFIFLGMGWGGGGGGVIGNHISLLQSW